MGEAQRVCVSGPGKVNVSDVFHQFFVCFVCFFFLKNEMFL